jgi:RNA polymerase sigma-70 factor (ECF subfamily)
LASTEEELVGLLRLSRAGDSRAYEDFLRKLVPVFIAYYHRRTRSSPSEADDFVQDCLLAIHQRQITYDSTRPLLPWVYAIAKHKLIDRFRSQKAKGDFSDFNDSDGSYEVEAALTARMDVEALLDRAPAKQRDAIIATKLVGDSVAEHAAASGLSLSDVKVSVHRGLKYLAGLVEGKKS